MSSEFGSDLQVESLSDALAGKTLDVVVSGSIGAVESVRFIRALRRLGAQVTPWLTAGGAQFITPLAVAWAAGRDVRTAFSGDASHIALGDACVVAPASAALLGKVAAGITDSPASALITSYLGAGKPVHVLPNMHESLASSPAVHRNLDILRTFGVAFLSDRREEGKRKFPEPATLADEVAHALNRDRRDAADVLITMGQTRGYLDDVRYVSNYSSGGLGSLITEELYRQGFAPHVVTGPSEIRPKSYASLTEIFTNDEMADAARKVLQTGARAAILAASVLDFVPKHKTAGKIASADHERLAVELTRTKKLIADLTPATGIKIGFKLETGLTAERASAIAHDYMGKYQLSMMVLNDLRDVDRTRHRALVYTQRPDMPAVKGGAAAQAVDAKGDLARLIARHVADRLAPGAPS